MTPLTYHLLWDICWATFTIAGILLVASLVLHGIRDGKYHYNIAWRHYVLALAWTFATLMVATLVVIVLCQTFVGHPDWLDERWNNHYHLVRP